MGNSIVNAGTFDVFVLVERRQFGPQQTNEATVGHGLRLSDLVQRARQWVSGPLGDEELRSAEVWLGGKVCVFDTGRAQPIPRDAEYFGPCAPGRYRCAFDAQEDYTWQLVGAGLKAPRRLPALV